MYSNMLELRSKKKTTSLFSWETRSVMKWAGTEYMEWRPYTENDDAHSIDWRTSARLPFPSLKLYESSHELRVCIIVNTSSSLFFAQGEAGFPSKADHLRVMLEKIFESCAYYKNSISLIIEWLFIPFGVWRSHREYIRYGLEHVFEEGEKMKQTMYKSPSLHMKQWMESISRFFLRWEAREDTRYFTPTLSTLIKRAKEQKIHDALVLILSDSYWIHDIHELAWLSAQNDVVCVYIAHAFEENPESISPWLLISDGERNGVLSKKNIELYKKEWNRMLSRIRDEIHWVGASFWKTESGEEKWEEKFNYFMRTR